MRCISVIITFCIGLSATAQTRLTVTSTNKVEGYLVMRLSDWAKYNDSVRYAARAEAVKAFQDTIGKMVKLETVREKLLPTDAAGKVYQLTGRPYGGALDAVTAIDPGGNVPLVPFSNGTGDYTIGVTTNRITLQAGRKALYVVYYKISQ